jgi:hypothetical protein
VNKQQQEEISQAFTKKMAVGLQKNNKRKKKFDRKKDNYLMFVLFNCRVLIAFWPVY